MTTRKIYEIVAQVMSDNGYGVDEFAEEAAEMIINDNGTDLTMEEVQELAAQFIEEDE